MVHSFDLVHARAEKVFDNWEAWFDPEAPDDVYPADLEHPMDAVEDMLEQGEVLWRHPGWISNLWEVLEDWASRASSLVRLKLTCEWLASTLPETPIDREVTQRIQLIAEGRLCEAFEGEYNHIHRDPEDSLCELNFNAARQSLEWQRSIPRPGLVGDWET